MKYSTCTQQHTPTHIHTFAYANKYQEGNLKLSSSILAVRKVFGKKLKHNKEHFPKFFYLAALKTPNIFPKKQEPNKSNMQKKLPAIPAIAKK